MINDTRYRLEQSILIPGLPGGNPDTGHCLLLQKLQVSDGMMNDADDENCVQMLNRCIARKIARESKSGQAQGGESGRGRADLSGDREADNIKTVL